MAQRYTGEQGYLVLVGSVEKMRTRKKQRGLVRRRESGTKRWKGQRKRRKKDGLITMSIQNS